MRFKQFFFFAALFMIASVYPPFFKFLSISISIFYFIRIRFLVSHTGKDISFLMFVFYLDDCEAKRPVQTRIKRLELELEHLEMHKTLIGDFSQLKMAYEYVKIKTNAFFILSYFQFYLFYLQFYNIYYKYYYFK